MKIQASVVGAEIDRLISSPSLPDVATSIHGIIDLCERDLPHPDWDALREIDYAGDVAALRAWFDRVLSIQPPEAPVRGLYFALSNPLLADQRVTIDLEVVGTEEYDASDPDMEWLFSRHHFPEVYAESSALHRLYGIAYGTHEFGAQIVGTLGNDAEWSIGLAFSVLATRAILEGRSVTQLLTDARHVGVAAGWGSGDMLLIGELTEHGFAPPAASQ